MEFLEEKASICLRPRRCYDADTAVLGTNDYEATRDSDVVVITAGIARKPGMSRDGGSSTNVKIVEEKWQKRPRNSRLTQ